MGNYYCTRADVTDGLDSLTGSALATTAQQDAKLLEPATRWIDSVYPGVAPFAPVPTNDPKGWVVAQSDHSANSSTVTVSGGSGNPAEGDVFRVVLAGQWSTDLDDLISAEAPSRPYRVTAYTTGLVSYEPVARDDFPQRAPLQFGPPALVREACRCYAMGLAYQLLRRNPLDELAGAMFEQARRLLGVSERGGRATVAPEVGWAFDPLTVRIV